MILKYCRTKSYYVSTKETWWTNENIWRVVTVIFGGVIEIMLVLGFTIGIIQPDGELTNNVTILVEITIGLVIAIVVYGLTKKEQKKTDNKIKSIQVKQAKDTYTSKSYELGQIIINLLLLLEKHVELRIEYDLIKNIPESQRTQDNIGPHISNLYTICNIYNRLIFDTAVLRREENVMRTLAMRRNLQIHYKNKDWEGLLEDLRSVMKTRNDIERCTQKIEDQMDDLERQYEESGRETQDEY